jgi:hypothetical protein
MLSHRKFAVLMLVKDAPDQVELGRDELESLLERQLISLENLASGRSRPDVTSDGESTPRPSPESTRQRKRAGRG